MKEYNKLRGGYYTPCEISETIKWYIGAQKQGHRCLNE